MADKYITMLLEKHTLRENEYIYTPVDAITIKEDGTNLLDENDDIIFPISTMEACDPNIKYAIDSFLCNYEAYIKDSKNKDDEDKIRDEYFDLNKQFYFHVVHDDKNVQITTLNTGINLNLDPDSLDYAKRVAENIKNNRYTTEDLKLIRNNVKREELRATEIGKLFDSAIKIYDENKQYENDEYEMRGINNIDRLYKQVTRTLVSQDRAAEEFITRLTMLDLDRNNRKGILLTGDSGVGKTKLVELVSRYSKRPVLMIDSTQLTIPGYVGKNIEEFLYDLLDQCDFDIEKAEKAIIFFDEIDKKGSSKKSDVSGQGVLNQLLKFLDGATYTACEDAAHKSNAYMNINTDDMIVVAGGAFNDVYHSPDNNNPLGFGGNTKEEASENNVSVDDFVEKAQMPREFMGRFSIIHLNSLEAKDYERILKESDESPLISAKNVFKEMDNVKLTFTNNYIKAASELAYNREVGVRGLSDIITESINNPFRYINQNLNKYKEVIIDDNILLDPDDYQLKEKTNIDNKTLQKLPE